MHIWSLLHTNIVLKNALKIALKRTTLWLLRCSSWNHKHFPPRRAGLASQFFCLYHSECSGSGWKSTQKSAFFCWMLKRRRKKREKLNSIWMETQLVSSSSFMISVLKRCEATGRFVPRRIWRGLVTPRRSSQRSLTGEPGVTLRWRGTCSNFLRAVCSEIRCGGHSTISAAVWSEGLKSDAFIIKTKKRREPDYLNLDLIFTAFTVIFAGYVNTLLNKVIIQIRDMKKMRCDVLFQPEVVSANTV